MIMVIIGGTSGRVEDMMCIATADEVIRLMILTMTIFTEVVILNILIVQKVRKVLTS